MRPQFDDATSQVFAELDRAGVLGQRVVDHFFDESTRLFSRLSTEEPLMTYEVVKNTLFGGAIVGFLRSWKRVINRESLGDAEHQVEIVSNAFEAQKVTALPLATALLALNRSGAQLRAAVDAYASKPNDILCKIANHFPGLVPDVDRWRRVRNAVSHSQVTIDIAGRMLYLGDEKSPSFTLDGLGQFGKHVAVFQMLVLWATKEGLLDAHPWIVQKLTYEMLLGGRMPEEFRELVKQAVPTPADLGVSDWDQMRPDDMMSALKAVLWRKMKLPSDGTGGKE